MNAFWKAEPLTEIEEDLISKVCDAHYACTMRNNPSTIALQMAAQGSGDYFRSLAAALVTYGGRHGPIGEAYKVLMNPELAPELLAAGKIVPGWGSSFTKGAVDPHWLPVVEALKANWPDVYETIDAITKVIQATGKNIFPNPSILTAGAAYALGIPERVAPALVMFGRLTAWTQLFLEATKDN